MLIHGRFPQGTQQFGPREVGQAARSTGRALERLIFILSEAEDQDFVSRFGNGQIMSLSTSTAMDRSSADTLTTTHQPVDSRASVPSIPARTPFSMRTRCPVLRN